MICVLLLLKKVQGHDWKSQKKSALFYCLLLSVNIKLPSPFVCRPSKRDFIGLGGGVVNPQFNSSWFICFTYVIVYVSCCAVVSLV